MSTQNPQTKFNNCAKCSNKVNIYANVCMSEFMKTGLNLKQDFRACLPARPFRCFKSQRRGERLCYGGLWQIAQVSGYQFVLSRSPKL